MLWEDYGYAVRRENDDILGTLVRTLLAQATTRENRERAFTQLLSDFSGDWKSVAEADVARVEAAIRVGGLAKRKAPRIQTILSTVNDVFGCYSLEPLNDWEVEDARTFLEKLPGVGPKTAAFTLMWAVGADTIALNTDLFRVLRRMGILARESDKKAHRLIQTFTPPGKSYQAHMALITHGRTICLTKTPLCESCSIKTHCDQIAV